MRISFIHSRFILPYFFSFFVSSSGSIITELEYYPEGYRTDAKIAVSFAVSGCFTGQLIIILDEQLAIKLASASLKGIPVSSFDKMAESAVCELGNIIGGSASMRLLENGYECDISAPQIRRNQQIVTESPTFAAKFDSEWGELQQLIKFASRSQIK